MVCRFQGEQEAPIIAKHRAYKEGPGMWGASAKILLLQMVTAGSLY